MGAYGAIVSLRTDPVRRDLLHGEEAVSEGRPALKSLGAPTTQVLCQYLQVWEFLRSVVLDPVQANRFCLEMVCRRKVLDLVVGIYKCTQNYP